MLALNLAIAAERDGLATIVIDIDPQASAATWGDIRDAEAPAIVAAPAARLDAALKAAKSEGAILAVIDTAPNAEGSTLSAMQAADLVLVPCRPALLDLQAIGATATLAKIAGKPTFVVMNAMPSGATRLAEDAQKAAAVHGLTTAPVTITHRADFTRALTAGQGVVEYARWGRAAQEVSRLCVWIYEQLGTNNAGIIQKEQPSRARGGSRQSG